MDEHWMHYVIAVLIGQGDGEVFISDAALAAVERCQIIYKRDQAKGGYYLSLAPDHSDGSNRAAE